MTLEDLQTRRDALILAMTNGVRSVTNELGNAITYQSIHEMERALARLDREIARLSGGGVRRVQVFSEKGY